MRAAHRPVVGKLLSVEAAISSTAENAPVIMIFPPRESYSRGGRTNGPRLPLAKAARGVRPNN